MGKQRFEDLPRTIQERCEKNILGLKYIDFLVELIRDGSKCYYE